MKIVAYFDAHCVELWDVEFGTIYAYYNSIIRVQPKAYTVS